MIEIYKKISEIDTSSIIVTDANVNIVYVNEAFTENTGYILDDVYGKNPNILRGDFTGLVDYKEMWRLLKSGQEWNGELYNKDKFGNYFWEFARISPVKDHKGVLYYVAVKQNITKIKDLEDKLVHLYNRIDESQ